MLYTLTNQHLTVTVSDFGAEIMSITGTNGTEYLWNRDPKYWRECSPVLFPYVGRMTEQRYTYMGKSYSMPLHGFAKRCEFTPIIVEESRIILGLTDSEECREFYPFAFEFSVCYELENNTLVITYAVENRSNGEMFFGLGGHPGFRLPLEEGKNFEDYRLTFQHPCHPNRVLLSENCLNSGQSIPYPLVNDTTLPLRHDLFDKDAIVLDHMDRIVTLSAGEGSRGVTVSLPQMRYLGIWHTAGNDTPFVCLEPWCSLPSRDGVVEDLSQQGDLIRLESGAVYNNSWTITVF